MPLKLDFKSGDKLVINGAVLENIGSNAKLLVHNESAILREKEVLTADETATPAARVYFALQCAYMFPEHKEQHLKTFHGYLNDYVSACPSATEIGDDILAEINNGKIYRALKKTQRLIHHERDLFQSMEKTLSDIHANLAEEDFEFDDEDEGDAAQ